MKYLIEDVNPGEEGATLSVSGCYFAEAPDGESEGAHITRSVEGVEIRNLTLFPGHLTRWGAVKWGVLGMLHLGPMRVDKIRRFFRMGRGN